MSIPRVQDFEEPVAFHCDCGSKSQELLKHYGLLRCTCGKFWWALRPKRNGRLRMFPWPGPNLTREELKSQEAS